MLNRPEVVKPHLLSKHHLGNHLFVGVLHDPWIVWFRNLDFIHQTEFHSGSLLTYGVSRLPSYLPHVGQTSVSGQTTVNRNQLTSNKRGFIRDKEEHGI